MKQHGLGYLFALSIPLSAGLCSVSGIDLAGFSHSGWIWVGLLVAALFLLLIVHPLERGRTIAFPVVPWLLPLGYMWYSLTWASKIDWHDVQQAIQISMPILVAVIVSLYVRSQAQLRELVKCYLIMLAMFGIATLAVRMGALSSLDLLHNNRPVAMGIGVVGVLFVAGASGKQLWPWLGWGLCVFLSLLTESRMATAALVVAPVFHPCFRSIFWRFAVLGMGAVVGLLLFYTPVFQRRFFHSGSGTLEDLFTDNFASFGRFEVWPLAWEESMQRPWFGHGVGTCIELMDRLWPGSEHVHNDYLRVFYELGAVGLVLFVSVCTWQAIDLLRQIRKSDGETRTVFTASFMGLGYLAILAITDNPLVYNAIFMNPLFALMGAAYGAIQHSTDPTAERASPRWDTCLPAMAKSRTSQSPS